MKKIIALVMIAAMIASIAAVSTSAAGQILFVDTFEGDALNPDNWLVDGNLFFVEDGWCKGWEDAVVNQSNFLEELDGNKKWLDNSCCVDAAFYEFDTDGDEFGAALWWRDYRWDPELEESVSHDVYWVKLHLIARQVVIQVDSEIEGNDTGIVATYDLPEDFEIKIDPSNPTIVNLGMRVNGTQIDGFLNGEKVVSYTQKGTIPEGERYPSPIILWNIQPGMYMGFDNFTVATVDYPLFAADNVVTPPVDNGGDENVTPPADTNGDGATPPAEDNGDENVTPPADGKDESGNQGGNDQHNKPADTNQGSNSQQPSAGTQTGDAAVIVLAVMIVSLGTAALVKKIGVR